MEFEVAVNKTYVEMWKKVSFELLIKRYFLDICCIKIEDVLKR